MTGKISIHNILLKGVYSWERFMEIDNSSCELCLRKAFMVNSSINCSYEGMLKSVHTSAAASTFGESYFDLIKIDLEDYHAEGDISYQTKYVYTSMLENKDGFSGEKLVRRVHTMEPKTRHILYQLTFRGPGVTYISDVISSQADAPKEINVTFTVRKFNWLCERNAVSVMPLGAGHFPLRKL